MCIPRGKGREKLWDIDHVSLESKVPAMKSKLKKLTFSSVTVINNNTFLYNHQWS